MQSCDLPHENVNPVYVTITNKWKILKLRRNYAMLIWRQNFLKVGLMEDDDTVVLTPKEREEALDKALKDLPDEDGEEDNDEEDE